MDIVKQLDALHEKHRLTNRVTPKRDWYRIENAAAPSTTDVFIFDEIGWFGITASDFISELIAIDTDSITLHLNSPGGEVFDGIAIYSTLRQHAAKVHVIIDGLAASIASVIAMAGDTITITPHGSMMVHDGMGMAIGNAAEHREMADLLDKISDNIAAVYQGRAGGTVEEWRETMRATTWFTAEEALAAGLVDFINESAPSHLDGDGDSFEISRGFSDEFDIAVFDQTDPAPEDPPPTPTPEIVFDADPFRDAFTAIRKAVSA